MTTPLIINKETMDEARDAIREIVMLYVGLADEGRFMHNSRCGRATRLSALHRCGG